MTLAIIAVITITMLASWAHGRGDDLHKGSSLLETKGTWVSATALVYGGCLYLVRPGCVSCAPLAWYWFIPAGIILSTCYWIVFRSGEIAHAELSYMDRKHEYDLWSIVGAYLPGMGVVTALCALLYWQSGLYSMMLAVVVGALLSMAAVLTTAYFSRVQDGIFLQPPKVYEPHRRKRRQRVELANGFAGGACISFLLHASITALRAL